MKRMIALLMSAFVVFSLGGCNFNHQKNIVESYEEPIYPLESLTEVLGVEANREIVLDFSNYDLENIGIVNYDFVNDTFHGEHFRGVQVEDCYELVNSNGHDVTMQMIYGFDAKFASSTDRIPVISVDDNEIDSEIVIGRTLILEKYDTPRGSNCERFFTWLVDEQGGNYIQNSMEAYSEPPVLDQTVQVYKLENIGCRTEEQEKMNIEVAVSRDSMESQIYTYGFDTFSSRNSQEQLGTEVPLEKDKNFGKNAYIIVTGEDVEISEILCYRTAQKQYYDWEEANVFDLVTYESTLEDVMREVLMEYRDINGTSKRFGDMISDEVFLDAGKQFLIDTEAERGTSITSLDYSVFQVIELEYSKYFVVFDVSIPALSSVDVVVSYEKPASVKEIDKKGYDMYDFLIRETISYLNLDYSSVTLTINGILEGDVNVYREEPILGSDLADKNYNIDGFSYYPIYVEAKEYN